MFVINDLLQVKLPPMETNHSNRIIDFHLEDRADLALTLADPELAAEKVATGAEEAATEGIEVLMAGGGMSAAQAMWNNMKALRQFQHSLETLVNNIRVIVGAIMDAFSSKSTTAPKKLDAKRSKKLQEAVKHFKTKSEQVAVVAKAEKMTPYKLSTEELQMLSDMVECSLFETTVAGVIRAKAPDATGFYCDACCSDLDPDARILGCKKCKESGGWFGGGSSCDIGICVRCSSLMLAHASKDVQERGEGSRGESWLQAHESLLLLRYRTPVQRVRTAVL